MHDEPPPTFPKPPHLEQLPHLPNLQHLVHVQQEGRHQHQQHVPVLRVHLQGHGLRGRRGGREHLVGDVSDASSSSKPFFCSQAQEERETGNEFLSLSLLRRRNKIQREGQKVRLQGGCVKGKFFIP